MKLSFCCFSVFYDVKIVLMKAKSVALLEFRRIIIQGRKGERERLHLTSTFQISNRNICSLTYYPLPVTKENYILKEKQILKPKLLLSKFVITKTQKSQWNFTFPSVANRTKLIQMHSK